MTVRIYTSADASAPVMTGEVGTLVALVDACLVTGYPGKAAAGWTKPYTTTGGAVYTYDVGSDVVEAMVPGGGMHVAGSGGLVG